jgi:hypothetical protein
MASKEEVVEYLQDLREHYNNYHEHKEKSALAAVVLYVLLAGTSLPIQLRGPDTLVSDGVGSEAIQTGIKIILSTIR